MTVASGPTTVVKGRRSQTDRPAVIDNNDAAVTNARLHLAVTDAGNELLATSPFALLIAMQLDQQIQVRTAFASEPCI